MGLFRGLFRRRQVATPWRDDSHLESLILADIYGSTIALENVPISRALAMSIPAMARARNVLATTGGRLRLVAETEAGPIRNQPYLTTQPEPGRTRFATFTWTIDQLLFTGRAWWRIIEREAEPPYRARRVELINEADLTFDDAGIPEGYLGRKIGPADLIRIDGPNEGILTFGARALRSALSIETAYAKVSRNPVPAVELHQTTPSPVMTDEAINKLIKAWIDARDKHGVAYTPHNIQLQKHGLPVEQLLIEGRKAAALDIARLASVPAWVVDAETSGSTLTYSNIESRSRELVDYGLGAYLAAIESRLSADDLLPRGTWCRFATDEITRGDLKSRAEAYSAAQAAGILTPDQCVALEKGKAPE